MSKYDIAIVYRIYPGVSKVPPIFSDDKLKLSELCLASFKEALEGVNYKLYAILDNCPADYVSLFQKYFDREEIELIEVPQTGNAGTFGMQMDILLNQEHSDIVFFAEDDYFYLPGAFRKMIDFMNSEYRPDFVSPFDHLDYYKLNLHKYDYDTVRFQEEEWRTASTTCMTFMTTKEILAESEKVFRTYTRNNYDASLWMSLTKINILNPAILMKLFFENNLYKRIIVNMWLHGTGQIVAGKKYKLYSPKPSLSTHMDDVCMAPDINWNLEFAKLLKNFNFS